MLVDGNADVEDLHPRIGVLPVATSMETILDTFRTRGLAVFDRRLNPEGFADLAARFGTIVPHPDADERGITLLSRQDARAEALNGRGFSDRELFPHTDRSSNLDPPDTVLMYCHVQAPSGGDTILVDGRALLRQIRKTMPALRKKLEAPQSAIFRSREELHLGSIVELDGGRVRRIRFRYDDQIYVSRSLARELDTLASLIAASAVRIRLDSGQGIALDNWRWLHGRTAFNGPRAVWRILINRRGRNV